MRRVLALVLAMSLMPLPALAEGVAGVVAIPPGDDKIVPLAARQPAPFDGQLFDTPTALRWANWLEQYRVRLKLDTEAQQKLSELETSLLTRTLELEQQKYVQVTEALQKQVTGLQEELRNPPWYKTPWFGFTAGVVGSFALVGATAWVVSAAH